MPGDEPENELLRPAAAPVEFPGLELLSADKLREIAARDGMDFATVLLYDRVKRSEPHAAFIRQMDEAQKLDRSQGAAHEFTIGIVPAAFYREKPHSGADGRVVREAATRAGFKCE